MTTTLELKAYGKKPATFRTITFDEVIAWATLKPKPCTCNKGIRVITVTSQEQADQMNARHEANHNSILATLQVGSTFDITCGACDGTGTRLVDTTPNHVWFVDRYGHAREAKVNGKVRTWKRDATRIELPLKYGLREYFTFSKSDIDNGQLLERLG